MVAVTNRRCQEVHPEQTVAEEPVTGGEEIRIERLLKKRAAVPEGRAVRHPRPVDRDVTRMPLVREPVVPSRQRVRTSERRHGGDEGVADAEHPGQRQRISRIEALSQPAVRAVEPADELQEHPPDETAVEHLARDAQRPVRSEGQRA